MIYSLVPNSQTGPFVKTVVYYAYRFVCCGQVRLLKKKNNNRDLSKSPTAGWAWCIWVIIVAHSSVRVNANFLPEWLGMYTITLPELINMQRIEWWPTLSRDTLTYLDKFFYSKRCYYCSTVVPLSSVAPQERLLPLNDCFSVHVCLLHC